MTKSASPAKKKAKQSKKQKALRKNLNKFSLAGSAVLSACYMYLFFAPFEIAAFNADSLVFDYWDVLEATLPWAAGVFAAGTLLLMLLKGKLFYCAVSLVFSLTVCGYLQSAFMNGTLGMLTGDAVDWSAYGLRMLGNLLIWLGIAGAVFFVFIRYRSFWKDMVTCVSLLLVIMQLTPTIAILAGAYGEAKISDIENLALSEEGFYEFSSTDNIFVFVLDRLDYDYIQKVLDEDPAYFDRLDGFTSYTNAVSAFARTQPALSHLLTGHEASAYQVSKEDFYKNIWTADGRNLLQSLKKQSYQVELYTTLQYLFSDADFVQRYVSNVNNDMGRLQKTTLRSKMLQLSAYRYLPLVLKPLFWASTDYYNEDVYTPIAYANYQFDDGEYGAGFPDSTANRTKKSFKFYHFTGAHSPYTINADGTKSDTITTVKDQTKGIFAILYAAFDRMKALGIYEESAILITADHGSAVSDTKPLSKATRIGLFYKPSGSAGTPLQHSAAQVCTDNVPATILKEAGGDYSQFGRALDEIGEEEELTRTYYKSVVNSEKRRETEVYKYAVTGDASDFANWELTEVLEIDQGFYGIFK